MFIVQLFQFGQSLFGCVHYFVQRFHELTIGAGDPHLLLDNYYECNVDLELLRT